FSTFTSMVIPPGGTAPFGSCARAIGDIKVAHTALVDSIVAMSLFIMLVSGSQRCWFDRMVESIPCRSAAAAGQPRLTSDRLLPLIFIRPPLGVDRLLVDSREDSAPRPGLSPCA